MTSRQVVDSLVLASPPPPSLSVATPISQLGRMTDTEVVQGDFKVFEFSTDSTSPFCSSVAVRRRRRPPLSLSWLSSSLGSSDRAVVCAAVVNTFHVGEGEVCARRRGCVSCWVFTTDSMAFTVFMRACPPHPRCACFDFGRRRRHRRRRRSDTDTFVVAALLFVGLQPLARAVDFVTLLAATRNTITRGDDVLPAAVGEKFNVGFGVCECVTPVSADRRTQATEGVARCCSWALRLLWCWCLCVCGSVCVCVCDVVCHGLARFACVTAAVLRSLCAQLQTCMHLSRASHARCRWLIGCHWLDAVRRSLVEWCCHSSLLVTVLSQPAPC